MHAIDYTLANAKGKLVKVINDLLSPAMVATEAREPAEPAEPAAKGQELQSKWCHECQGIPLQWLGMHQMHDILFNDWIADLFLQHSSTIQHVSTVYEYVLSIMSCEIRWYVDISMWHATGWSWHVFDPTWPSPGSALSHVTAVTARREGSAGEHSRCHDADAPYRLHRCNSQLWLMVIGWWNMVWWCLIL